MKGSLIRVALFVYLLSGLNQKHSDAPGPKVTRWLSDLPTREAELTRCFSNQAATLPGRDSLSEHDSLNPQSAAGIGLAGDKGGAHLRIPLGGLELPRHAG